MSGQNRIEWEGKHFSCFTNRACEYFPCHEGVEPGSFNCLFCYCPLYALGTACGGNFVMALLLFAPMRKLLGKLSAKMQK